MSTPKPNISSLPPELLLQILNYLNPVDNSGLLTSDIISCSELTYSFLRTIEFGFAADTSVFAAVAVCKEWRKILLEDVLKVEDEEVWRCKMGMFREVAGRLAELREIGTFW